MYTSFGTFDTPTVIAEESVDLVVQRVTGLFVARLREMRDCGETLPAPDQAATALLEYTNLALAGLAAVRKEAAKTGAPGGTSARPVPQVNLLARQAADLVLAYRHVVLIQSVDNRADRDSALLAVYDESEGLYVECTGTTTP